MQFDFDNRGGIRRIYALPNEDVLSIDNSRGLGIVSVQMGSTDRIVELPCYAGQNYSFSEEHTLKEQGDRYAVAISGVIPSQLIDAGTTEKLRRGEWLVLHQDTRGRIRLSGTKLIPLRFSSTSSTGADFPELNGEAFSFSATEAESSPECSLDGIIGI